MQNYAGIIWRDVQALRAARPLVLSVTNNVVTNFTANALLALGASPAMSHAEDDAEELAGFSGAVNLNMGTPAPDYVKSLFAAGKSANKRSVPVVFDPVAAGATRFRAELSARVVKEIMCSIIRGNASEIMALAGVEAKVKGVDSLEGVEKALEAARALSAKAGCVVCVSGESDVVVAGRKAYALEGGHPMMTLVTGMGCAASAICAAFAAVNPDLAQATLGAMAVMSLAGEIASEGAAGPGSLAVRFLDALYALTEEDINARLRLSEL